MKTGIGRCFPRIRMQLAAVGLALVAGWSAGCDRSAEGKGKADEAPPVPVQTAVAVQRDVPRTVDSIGAVQALRTVAIKSQVDGIIAQIHFREGDEVKAGDLLVTLDRRPFENSLRIARASLANAQAEAEKATADLNRYKRLQEQQAISQEQFAELSTKAATTEAQLQGAQAGVANAELQLGYTEIRAPIAGRTGQLILHEGALVKANDVNQSIVTVNQLTPMGVAYAVPEDALPEIRAALAQHRVHVTVADRAESTTPIEGKLEFVDNAVDATTGTITLKATFPNEDHSLWPGQFVHVTTETGVDRGAVVVPTAAVENGQSGSQVFVVDAAHKVALRPVKIERTTGDFALVTGVQAGETVVTDGQLRLVPGVRVEAKDLSGQAPAAEAEAAR
ncbi:efflux RND transporter periplasmic adaptor subunit [Horticoccus luteus]|uniref:Efflux RND transporter periplasmic adaptor subunit n=1 Tax=Horticoccus luteus TaxID=2862869 RepID=A0A8F9XHM6_9BACT|nr:efflux RND transporter periplasmic adaptor subunit [Horticoccus luteus]QYM79495.1 efflux RND transporter periplasmic adaptor subunit [Horticoccus luteus]